MEAPGRVLLWPGAISAMTRSQVRTAWPPCPPAALGGPGWGPAHPELLDRQPVQSPEAWSPCPELPICHVSWDKSLNKRAQFPHLRSEADGKPLRALPSCGAESKVRLG